LSGGIGVGGAGGIGGTGGIGGIGGLLLNLFLAIKNTPFN